MALLTTTRAQSAPVTSANSSQTSSNACTWRRRHLMEKTSITLFKQVRPFGYYGGGRDGQWDVLLTKLTSYPNVSQCKCNENRPLCRGGSSLQIWPCHSLQIWPCHRKLGHTQILIVILIDKIVVSQVRKSDRVPSNAGHALDPPLLWFGSL